MAGLDLPTNQQLNEVTQGDEELHNLAKRCAQAERMTSRSAYLRRHETGE
jgi:hypothetical protein